MDIPSPLEPTLLQGSLHIFRRSRFLPFTGIAVEPDVEFQQRSIQPGAPVGSDNPPALRQFDWHREHTLIARNRNTAVFPRGLLPESSRPAGSDNHDLLGN